MEFSENTRVKIPALVHATRLGYKYISLKEIKNQLDPRMNIFKTIFKDSINKINNTDLNEKDIDKIIDELDIELNNKDLGRKFYKTLLDGIDGIKLIDFDDIDNNTLNVLTELPYENGEDNFRPDVIMLINGMPLGFVEVKKPNNRDGILAERSRINDRFHNEKFRKFMNITQILVFSNNQEYNNDSIVPIEGAFYGTPSNKSVFFNCFREEEPAIFDKIGDISDSEENYILKDNNYVSIKGTSEYSTNLSRMTPTNKLITSLFHKNRIFKLLKYGIAYVEKANKNGVVEIEKHIMRYQQLFATFAIENKIKEGIKKGIIWHTQGSGKTALAYFNVKYLTDYYAKQSRVAKFYFIVDRLDLLKQASEEFEARGLNVVKVNSRDDFKKNIAMTGEASKNGKLTINVVNIQKFSEDSTVKDSDYNVDVQRIYFLDEAHRDYNPKGSFLSNLMASDRNSIKIALTGTPLVNQEIDGMKYSSKDIFGDYIHKYYYNKSIMDGYTLKLIREGVQAEYKVKIAEALDQVREILKDAKESNIVSHPVYTEALAEYITKDFGTSRTRFGDDSIGAMIVCDSQAQARNLFKSLDKYDFSKILILYNEDNKQVREEEIKAYKEGKIDILVVDNMLLTGFDAPRLKKLYLGRVIRAHNLLQALTRVNRPYKNFRYGYVVDFADIRDEFDKTNQIYFNELQEELGEDFEHYSSIFVSSEDAEKRIEEIKDKLFLFDFSNKELLSSQISSLEKKELIDLRRLVRDYKDLYNIIKSLNYIDLIEKVDILSIDNMSREINRRLDILNLSEDVNSNDGSNPLNMVFENLDIKFNKINEGELIISDKYLDKIEEVRRKFINNIDKDDKYYTSLANEFNNLFKMKNIEELTIDDINENMKKLTEIEKNIDQLNLKNSMLLNKLLGDEKYVKIYKRVKDRISDFSDSKLVEILLEIKNEVDDLILRRNDILDNVEFFKSEVGRCVYMTSNEETKIIDEIDFFVDLIVTMYEFERKVSNNG